MSGYTIHQELYLVVRPSRQGLAARVLTRAPRLAADEISLLLTLALPDTLFKKPALRASIVIPDESVNRPVIDSTVVDNIKSEIQKQLGVELTIAVMDPTTER